MVEKIFVSTSQIGKTATRIVNGSGQGSLQMDTLTLLVVFKQIAVSAFRNGCHGTTKRFMVFQV